MIVKVTLEVEINTDEPKSVIEDRIRSCDWSSLVDEEFDFALEEFGEVVSISLDDVA